MDEDAKIEKIDELAHNVFDDLAGIDGTTHIESTIWHIKEMVELATDMVKLEEMFRGRPVPGLYLANVFDELIGGDVWAEVLKYYNSLSPDGQREAFGRIINALSEYFYAVVMGQVKLMLYLNGINVQNMDRRSLRRQLSKLEKWAEVFKEVKDSGKVMSVNEFKKFLKDIGFTDEQATILAKAYQLIELNGDPGYWYDDLHKWLAETLTKEVDELINEYG